jgi:hypothetical protein
MGCNCKKSTKQVLNNVYNVDVVNYAKEIYERVLLSKTIEELNDVDKIEIMGAYASLYPASSVTPTMEDAINQIRIGIELYAIRTKR